LKSRGNRAEPIFYLKFCVALLWDRILIFKQKKSFKLNASEKSLAWFSLILELSKA
jgi:hypothetical protein